MVRLHVNVGDGMVEGIEITIDDNHRTGGDVSALPQATRTQLEKLCDSRACQKRSVDAVTQRLSRVRVSLRLRHPNSNRPIRQDQTVFCG